MKKWDKICFIIFICLSAGVRLSSYDEGDAVVIGGFDLFGFVTQIFEYGLLLYCCYVYRRILLPYVRYLRFAMPVVLMVLASTMWSVLPAFTFRRGVTLLLVSLLGYCMGVFFDPAELCELYVRSMRAVVFLSLFVLAFLRKFGISHGAHAGAWRGAFYHKNRAGEMMALAFITFALVVPARLPPVQRWGLAAITLVLLYKTQASTPIIAIAIVIAAQALWNLLLMRRKAIVGLVLAGYPLVLLAAGMFVIYSKSFFKLFGKDATFSGRDRLWSGVIDAIKLRPLLGYGYEAFWLEQGGQTTLTREKTSFVTVHAHNGFLNTLLHVGAVGLILFLIFLISTLWITVREGRRTHSVQTRWFFSFIVLFGVANLTESQILESPLLLITMIAFYTSFSIQRAESFAKPIANSEPLMELRAAYP